MKRLVPILSLLAVVAALAGCGRGGSEDPSAGRPSTVDENDDRAIALDCLTRVRGLDARLEGEHEVVVGADDTGPKIRFFLTGGESEARQFEGKAEGSEQIGNTLLYVRKGSDDVIEDVEFCLDHL
jgi:predicted small lipoprotein YifL